MSRLDEIKAREQAAFGGPWHVLDADENGMHAVAVDGTVLVEVGDFCDAEFIAHARDDIPHLLALVESLTAERDALVTTVGRVQALVDSNPDHADTCGSVLTPGAGYPCSCWQTDLRAALRFLIAQTDLRAASPGIGVRACGRLMCCEPTGQEGDQ